MPGISPLGSGPRFEELHGFRFQRRGNCLDHVDRCGVFRILDLANVAPVNVRAVSQCLLADPLGPADLLNIQTKLYPQLHALGRATM